MTTFFWITGVVLFIFLAAMVYMAAGLVKLVYVQTLRHKERCPQFPFGNHGGQGHEGHSQVG